VAGHATIMSEPTGRQQLYEELVRRLAAALRGTQLYSRGHPLSVRTTSAVLETLRQIHLQQPSIAIGLVGKEIVVGDIPLPRVRENMTELIARLQARGIERVTIDRGVDADELVAFLQAVTETKADQASVHPQGPGSHEDPPPIVFPHIRAGRLKLDANISDSAVASSTLRRLYQDSVATAELLWNSALEDGKPELPAARESIDGLAEAVTAHRAALLGLAAIKKYDNYTFTHMVNVSILTMGQARTLGIEGRLLRELGLAGLMHDIGKTRTPLEVLNKVEKLLPEEFEILKRHTVDGAEILRRTPDMPTMVPVVAFEHHLRIDGGGYPAVRRHQLNLGTMLCGISDVYDAMRSKRKYQQAFPSERILAVLQGNDGKQFDKHLVRRFVHLLGIYPPGSLVRISTDEIALVVQPYAGDPYRPRVKILLDAAGTCLDTPHTRDLWKIQPDTGAQAAVTCPLDPDAYGIDPLTYM
jgi:putative nucleotidyltransferase with HDIG domain